MSSSSRSPTDTLERRNGSDGGGADGDDEGTSTTSTASSTSSECRTHFETAKSHRPHSPTIALFECALKLWEREAERADERIKELQRELEECKRKLAEPKPPEPTIVAESIGPATDLVQNVGVEQSTVSFAATSSEVRQPVDPRTSEPPVSHDPPTYPTSNELLCAPVSRPSPPVPPSYVGANARPTARELRFVYPNITYESKPPVFTSPIICTCPKCETARQQQQYSQWGVGAYYER